MNNNTLKEGKMRKARELKVAFNSNGTVRWATHELKEHPYAEEGVLFREVLEPSSELGGVEKKYIPYPETRMSDEMEKIRDDFAIEYTFGNVTDEVPKKLVEAVKFGFNVGYRNGAVTEINRLTKQLDEVTKVKERYEEALEFYANQDSWIGYHRDCTNILNDDVKAKCKSDDFDIIIGGKRAREALNGSGDE